jgi:hypothetical protein
MRGELPRVGAANSPRSFASVPAIGAAISPERWPPISAAFVRSIRFQVAVKLKAEPCFSRHEQRPGRDQAGHLFDPPGGRSGAVALETAAWASRT